MPVSLHEIQLGENPSEKFTAVIETTKGSSTKYELDKKSGEILPDKEVQSGATFPFDYGFAPQTLWHDGDNLDVLIISNQTHDAGSSLSVRPIAIINMTDREKADDKIIAVPIEEEELSHLQDLNDIDQDLLDELRNFFETYKSSPGQDGGKSVVVISGYDGREEAVQALEKGRSLYTGGH